MATKAPNKPFNKSKSNNKTKTILLIILAKKSLGLLLLGILLFRVQLVRYFKNY